MHPIAKPQQAKPKSEQHCHACCVLTELAVIICGVRLHGDCGLQQRSLTSPWMYLVSASSAAFPLRIAAGRVLASSVCARRPQGKKKRAGMLKAQWLPEGSASA
jgi:hypothetical protein